ncbi:hypothetical protein AB0O31_12865 [Kitasatospora cineracea]|uniref:hypothetical protein n=1 Tax=Kitasatospora cineracea TaxID=88074 RepID=UPI00341D3142
MTSIGSTFAKRTVNAVVVTTALLGLALAAGSVGATSAAADDTPAPAPTATAVVSSNTHDWS